MPKALTWCTLDCNWIWPLAKVLPLSVLPPKIINTYINGWINELKKKSHLPYFFKSKSNPHNCQYAVLQLQCEQNLSSPHKSQSQSNLSNLNCGQIPFKRRRTLMILHWGKLQEHFFQHLQRRKALWRANGQMVLMTSEASTDLPLPTQRCAAADFLRSWNFCMKNILWFCETFHVAHQVSIHGSIQPAHQLVGWIRDTLFSGQYRIFTSAMFDIIMEKFPSVFWDTVTDRNALPRRCRKYGSSTWTSLSFFNCKKKTGLLCRGGGDSTRRSLKSNLTFWSHNL